MKARIYYVDDELMAIKYFKYLLEESGMDYELVGEATNGVKAIPEILRLHPDIVFADISMPVMNGLQMAEELLKKDENQKIVILTSYRDFDYAKRGMKIGITEYVLKNELSEAFLKELITGILQESLKEKKEQHLVIEHNIRKFLLADSPAAEDHIYEQKPFQRYALISIVKKPKICLQLPQPPEHVQADCFEIENLIYPEGITCRAVVEMSEGEWCSLFFIDTDISDSMPKLKEACKILAEAFSSSCKDCVYLISEPIRHFLKLPKIYKEIKKQKDYVYVFPNQQIFLPQEMNRNKPDSGKNKQKEDSSLETYLENLGKFLGEENKKEALYAMEQLLKNSRVSRNIWEYTEDIRNLERYLKQYVQEKKMDPKIMEFKETSFDADRIEELFTGCLETIFLELEERKKHQYSFYIVRAIEFIQKNYSRDISIPDIAEAVKISEGHLRKCFKLETNKKIVDYLTEYRLSRAKSLMKNGERRIDEIWQKTGFTSSQYFSYVFKRNEGMTPSDYLRQISK